MSILDKLFKGLDLNQKLEGIHNTLNTRLDWIEKKIDEVREQKERIFTLEEHIIGIEKEQEESKKREKYLIEKQVDLYILIKNGEYKATVELIEDLDCKHEWIYNKIRNELKNTIKYEITCKKCGFVPPDDYSFDERTKNIFKKYKSERNKSFDDKIKGSVKFD